LFYLILHGGVSKRTRDHFTNVVKSSYVRFCTFK